MNNRLIIKLKAVKDVLFCDDCVIAIIKGKRLSTHIYSDFEKAGQMIDALSSEWEAHV